jgi:hypothetical protein
MNFCYSEELIFISSIFAKAEKYTTQGRWGEASMTTCLNFPPSWSVHMPCSYHTEPGVFLMLTFYP